MLLYCGYGGRPLTYPLERKRSKVLEHPEIFQKALSYELRGVKGYR